MCCWVGSCMKPSQLETLSSVGPAGAHIERRALLAAGQAKEHCRIGHVLLTSQALGFQAAWCSACNTAPLACSLLALCAALGMINSMQ